MWCTYLTGQMNPFLKTSSKWNITLCTEFIQSQLKQREGIQVKNANSHNMILATHIYFILVSHPLDKLHLRWIQFYTSCSYLFTELIMKRKHINKLSELYMVYGLVWSKVKCLCHCPTSTALYISVCNGHVIITCNHQYNKPFSILAHDKFQTCPSCDK